jgi:hypothetical protein
VDVIWPQGLWPVLAEGLSQTLVVVLGLILLALLPGRRGPSGVWDWRIDPALAVVVAVVVASLQASWFVHFPLAGDVVTTSDFQEYCASIDLASQRNWGPMSRNRSRLPGLLLAQLRGPGVIESLATGAVLSAGVTAGGVYLWGRGLHGRLAGVLAALAILTLHPLVTQVRTLSYYPMITATLCVCCGLAAVAVRLRHPVAMLFAGAGMGLALSMDLRGLIWVLPCLSVCVAASMGSKWVHAPLRWLGLAVPIWVSWATGRYAYKPETTPLEIQANLRARLHELGFQVGDPFDIRPPEFVWGRSPMGDLPDTLQWLAAEGEQMPAMVDMKELVRTSLPEVEPWMGLAAVCLILAVWGLRKRPWLAGMLLGSVLPFALTLRNSVLVLKGLARFVAQGMPALALVMGLAAAVLVQGHVRTAWRDRRHEPAQWWPVAWLQAGRRRWGARVPTPPRWMAAVDRVHATPWMAWVWSAGVVGWALVLVLGMVPSRLSPAAPWRSGASPSPDGYSSVVCVVHTAAGRGDGCFLPPTAASCVQAVRGDLDDPGPWTQRLLDVQAP